MIVPDKEDSIPISSISEFVYCKRRWYLRNVEKLSADNALIIEGKIQHEDVHTPKIMDDGEKIIVNNLQVYYHEYNLYGFCDEVEFIYKSDGIKIPYCDYPCIPIPVEYKHGRVRESKEYESQVVAQALCLENMFGCKIDHGFIYYIEDKTRKEVLINKTNRRDVMEALSLIREYGGYLIKPEYSKKCKVCAMKDICQPKKHNIEDYIGMLWEG